MQIREVSTIFLGLSLSKSDIFLSPNKLKLLQLCSLGIIHSQTEIPRFYRGRPSCNLYCSGFLRLLTGIKVHN